MSSKDAGIEQKPPFAHAGPTALITLGFYVSLLWPLATGMLDGSYAGVLIPVGIIIAIIQLICGVIELRNGNLLGGTISLAFSCFMALGAGETLLKLYGLMPVETGPIDGYIMVVMGVLMAMFLPIAVRDPLVVFVFFLTNALFFTPAGIGHIFNLPGLVRFSHIIMPFVCPLAVWIGIAQILESETGKPMLWMGRPLMKTPAHPPQ